MIGHRLDSRQHVDVRSQLSCFFCVCVFFGFPDTVCIHVSFQKLESGSFHKFDFVKSSLIMCVREKVCVCVSMRLCQSVKHVW